MRAHESKLMDITGRKQSPAAEDEWVEGEDLSRAVEIFKVKGYVIIRDLLPLALVESLREEYTRALAAKVERLGLQRVDYYDERGQRNDEVLNDFKPEGGNHDLNRWNMHLPSRLPFFDERVFVNPTLLSIVEKLFGQAPLCYLIASDTPYPGAGFQSIHQDFSTFSIALNIPLIDFREDNAPIEIWPGTHRPDIGGPPATHTTDQHLIDAALMLKIKATVPSKRLLFKAGSVLLRDHRLVHRGTANLSQQPRPMLSIYYVRDHPVPYRRVADFGARMALFLRKTGRGRGPVIQHPALFNLGNILGRVVEESSLTDRDYRRKIPASLWTQLSPRAQSLLRYASVEAVPESRRISSGSLRGVGSFLLAWMKNCSGFLYSTLSSRPRVPDYETHRTRSARP
jgi:ectoine hydroxylase-related dioxygenase (phytanoyl-CoA dioxygenase family)